MPLMWVTDFSAERVIPSSDPDFSSVSFLCSFNGADAATAATDDSNNAHSITFNGNAQLTTTNPKFGSACLTTGNSSSDYCEVANDTSLLFGSGDFTVEMWMKSDQEPTANAADLASVWDDGSNERSWILEYEPGVDALKCYVSTTGVNIILVSQIDLGTGGSDLWDSAWHHVAWVREGDVYTVYVDGTAGSVANTQAGALHASTAPMFIMDSFIPGHIVDGEMDEMRITKGVARYTAAFTPPNSAFPRS